MITWLNRPLRTKLNDGTEDSSSFGVGDVGQQLLLANWQQRLVAARPTGCRLRERSIGGEPVWAPWTNGAEGKGCDGGIEDNDDSAAFSSLDSGQMAGRIGANCMSGDGTFG